MNRQRRSYTASALCALVLLLSGCASSDRIHLPDAVRSRLPTLTQPPDNAFDTQNGDEQYVDNFPKKYGVIYPHNASINGGIANKWLARIRLTKKHRDIPQGWSYWYMWDRAGNGQRADFVSIFIPAATFADQTTWIVRPLSFHDERGPAHTHVMGRWKNQSLAEAWVACDGTTCCCSGSSCKAFAW